MVLLAPLAALILLSPKRRSKKHLIYASLGGFLGALPLVIVNLYTFVLQQRLLSLADLNGPHSKILFTSFVKSYLGLASGHEVKVFILGVGTPFLQEAEVLINTLMLTVTLVGVYFFRCNGTRPAGIMLNSYIGIFLSLFVLPKVTWVHHWIIGSPFQYAAISLLGYALWSQRDRYSVPRKLDSAIRWKRDPGPW